MTSSSCAVSYCTVEYLLCCYGGTSASMLPVPLVYHTVSARNFTQSKVCCCWNSATSARYRPTASTWLNVVLHRTAVPYFLAVRCEMKFPFKRFCAGLLNSDSLNSVRLAGETLKRQLLYKYGYAARTCRIAPRTVRYAGRHPSE